MKYIGKVLLSFLLVVSVLLGSNPFYASAQAGDDAGLRTSSSAETTFKNPINLPNGQYRIKMNFFSRRDGEYFYYKNAAYSLAPYALLTVDGGDASLKIKKYTYEGSYANLFLKSNRAVEVDAEVNRGSGIFPSFAAQEEWKKYSSNQSKFTDKYTGEDFYTEEELDIEKINGRNAVYFNVPVDLQDGCLGYYSWDLSGALESYYIVPDVSSAVSLDELKNAKTKDSMGYYYTDRVITSSDNGGRNAKNNQNFVYGFDILEYESDIVESNEEGMTASFTINSRFTGDSHLSVEHVYTSPTDNPQTDRERYYRWGTGTSWEEVNVNMNNGSFQLTFTDDEIIFGKEVKFQRNVTISSNKCWHMTILPLTEPMEIRDITDEDSGITFRYSTYCIPGDIRFEAEKITEESDVPEGLWNFFYGEDSGVDHDSVNIYKFNVTYADGTPIPEVLWENSPYALLFPSIEGTEGMRVAVSAYQEKDGWSTEDIDDNYVGQSTLEVGEGEVPQLVTYMNSTDLASAGYTVQDQEALYYTTNIHQSLNFSNETYALAYTAAELININTYSDGIYKAKVQLLRQGSSYISACAGLLSPDATIVISEGGTKKEFYLNFTEEGEVSFGSGFYQGGLKAYDNITNEYIEDSEVVYSYMCNSDGTLLDNTSYNALTEFPCILSTKITLDDRSVYSDSNLRSHYRLGIFSPVMAAMSGTPYEEVYRLGVDLGVTSITPVGDLTNTEMLNSIPTYQKSVLMRSIQRGDLYLEGKADYSAESVAALEGAVEAGRTYYYNDLKDVDNKSAGKEQSDRIKELSDAIEDAITALGVPENVDKSALKAAIDKANALTEGEYTTLSWGALSKALSDAVVTNNRADVSQSVVDAEVKNLEAAMAALEKRSGDAAAPATLSDGVYRIPAGLYKGYNVKGVSDAALDVAYLEVKDGQAKVTLSFVPWEDGAVNLTALSTLSNITSQVWNPYEIADCERTPVEPTETYAVGEESYPKEMVLDVTLPATLDSSDNYIWTETTVRSGETETTEYARLYLDYTGILNVTDAWNALETAESYMETDYTADSWKTFADALAALENALSGQADKASLQAAVDALADAQKALEKVSEPATEQPSTQSPQQTTQEPQTGQQTPAAGEPQTGSQQTAPVAGMVGEIFKVKGNTYRLTSNGASPAATLVKASKKKAKITVPASVKKNGVAVSVTAIGNNAFKNRKKVRTVVIGKNVQQIGKNAFAGCEKLRKITVKTKTLRMVGKNALRGISSRAVVKVPKKSLKRYQKLFRNKGQRRTVVIR